MKQEQAKPEPVTLKVDNVRVVAQTIFIQAKPEPVTLHVNSVRMVAQTKVE